MSSEIAAGITIKNISKKFPAKQAVDGISFTIPSGTVYALIGPNGAGKTTLLKMMVGLLQPDAGSIKIHGFDIEKEPMLAKKQFAYIPDDPTGYDYLSGKEFLVFTGKLYNLSKKEIEQRMTKLLDLFPLEETLQQRISTYSRGNKEKIVFLASLLTEAKVLIIDEPIVGLDPQSIAIFGKTLQEHTKKGGTVLFSTHILSFAKEYADRMGILVDGKLVHETDIKKGVNLDEMYEKYTKQS